MFDPKQLPQIQSWARTIRGLSIDAIQKANSGHPGLPLGCADIGAMLFSQFMKHDPADPAWVDRDRFVLSAGHGSMFIYSLLHLAGYGLTIDDIKQFRQIGSYTPGHPEYGLTKGVEITTGPLGAGFASAVGMAIAETHLAATFNTSAHKVVDHYTWTLAGDGCLMEGVSAEAASLAGHLGLGKLIAFYDSNRITIEGETDIAFTEDVAARFKAYGWQVLNANGYKHQELADAVQAAKAETGKPTLIICDTIIGFGSPNKGGSHEVHGAPLGADEIKATKKAIGLDPDKDFQVAQGDYDFQAVLKANAAKQNAEWKKTFAAWATANPELKKKWDLYFDANGTTATSLPAIKWPDAASGSKAASRQSSGACLQTAAAALPNLIGGSADLSPSNNTELKGLGDYQKATPLGRNLHFGVREHAMGSIVNGMTLHGGLRVFGATFLVFSDYMRPTMRLAALMKIPSIFVFTHDSIWVGEDGPTHQPIEHVGCMRAIPGLEVIRPADAEETALAWQLSLEKKTGTHKPAVVGHPHAASVLEGTSGVGPTTLVLTRQALLVAAKPAAWQESVRKNGAYVAFEPENKKADVVVFATGSEVGVAIGAAQALASEGKSVRVVSVMSFERLRTSKAFSSLVPQGASVYGIEAGSYLGWGEFVRKEHFLGIDSFGECGPGEKVAAHFGITVDGLKALIKA